MAPSPGRALFNKLPNRLLLNALVFQTGWILCVAGGDRMALIAAACALVLHRVVNGFERAEWLLIALSAAIGIGLDSALQLFGVLRFTEFAGWGAPLWLAALWVLFATTLNHSLRWLQGRPWWAALCGALFAPFSYWAGTRLGAARFGIATPAALAVLAVCWSLLLPLLSAMMRHRIQVLALCRDF